MYIKDWVFICVCQKPREQVKNLLYKLYEFGACVILGDDNYPLQKAYVQVRDLSLRILGACVILGQQSLGDTNNKNGVDHGKVRPMNEVLEDLVQQYKTHLNNIQEFSKPYAVSHLKIIAYRAKIFLCNVHMKFT